MLESIFEFICEHPLITLFIVYMIWGVMTSSRLQKRVYDSSVDTYPDKWKKDKKREYDTRRDFLIADVLRYVFWIAFLLWIGGYI